MQDSSLESDQRLALMPSDVLILPYLEGKGPGEMAAWCTILGVSYVSLNGFALSETDNQGSDGLSSLIDSLGAIGFDTCLIMCKHPKLAEHAYCPPFSDPSRAKQCRCFRRSRPMVQVLVAAGCYRGVETMTLCFLRLASS